MSRIKTIPHHLFVKLILENSCYSRESTFVRNVCKLKFTILFIFFLTSHQNDVKKCYRKNDFLARAVYNQND